MRFFLLLLLLLCPALAAAQGWGFVEGTVTEAATGTAMPNATVLITGSNFGTVTGTDGAYRLRLPEGRYQIRFSSVGYQTRFDSLTIQRARTLRLNVALRDETTELGTVEVVDQNDVGAEAGVIELRPEDVRDIPAPFRDVFRALKSMPGVVTNNELSNEYSVRGGGYNENLIFLNGFEVFKPLRTRQGEQEGLGLLNLELIDRITFYTGGFPARYGGKLSSALDVRYTRPDGEPLHGSAYLSALDGGLTLGASALDGKIGWTLAGRRAQARRFFATQELQGEYDPDYADVQGTLAYQFARNHEISVLGMYAKHAFRLQPNQRKTTFGTFDNLFSAWSEFEGLEEDGYATGFVGVRLASRFASWFRMEHDVSLFETEEVETFDVTGRVNIYRIKDPAKDPNDPENLIPAGAARQADFADNQVAARTLAAQGRYQFIFGRHAAEIGWIGRQLRFDDRLDERTEVTGVTLKGAFVTTTVDSLQDAAAFDSEQVAVYVQDSFDALPERDRLIVSAGLRADYFAFNDELTFSPRLSARYRLSDRTVLNGALGLYHQHPTYRELRGDPAPGETIIGALNRNLKSQRSVQVIAGAEHFFPSIRFWLRGEAYYKHLSNLVSYDVNNVRVSYSGENDAEGYAYGLDLQLRGEFVPGLESWVNYSFLVTKERFLPAFRDAFKQGWIARPSDQRHTFSLFLQDYIPGNDTWKLHTRILFGSGLPYTPNVLGEVAGGQQLQVPGPRYAGRYPEYKRIDMGATKMYDLGRYTPGRDPVRLQLTFELLNVFDMKNTVAYSYIVSGNDWTRLPTRLTPRTFNVRMRLEL